MKAQKLPKSRRKSQIGQHCLNDYFAFPAVAYCVPTRRIRNPNLVFGRDFFAIISTSIFNLRVALNSSPFTFGLSFTNCVQNPLIFGKRMITITVFRDFDYDLFQVSLCPCRITWRRCIWEPLLPPQSAFSASPPGHPFPHQGQSRWIRACLVFFRSMVAIKTSPFQLVD